MLTITSWTLAYAFFASIEFLTARGGGDAHRLRANRLNGMVTLAAHIGSSYLIMLAAVRIAPALARHPLVADLRGASASWQIALATVALIVLGDLGYYVLHRAQHRYEWLWCIHALHHSDAEYDASTYLRTHWLEYPIQNLVIGLPLIVMFWMPEPAYLAATVATSALSFWNHADLPIGLGPLTRVVSGPEYHRSHHLRGREWSEANLTSFVPLWDVVFGTYRDPSGSFDHPVGDEDARNEIHRQLLWPWIGHRTAQTSTSAGATRAEVPPSVAEIA